VTVGEGLLLLGYGLIVGYVVGDVVRSRHVRRHADRYARRALRRAIEAHDDGIVAEFRRELGMLEGWPGR